MATYDESIWGLSIFTPRSTETPLNPLAGESLAMDIGMCVFR
jgi:hypothetical protein